MDIFTIVELVAVGHYLEWVTVRVLSEKVRYFLAHLRRRHIAAIVLSSYLRSLYHSVVSISLIARKRHLLGRWVSN